MTIDEILLEKENVLSVFGRTKKKKKTQTNHAELFIRWVLPYIIKGKMRTNEMQSFGDYITTGTFTGAKSHSHNISLQGGWGKTQIRVDEDDLCDEPSSAYYGSMP